MEILARLFPYGKTIAVVRKAREQGPKRKVAHPLPKSSSPLVMIMPCGGDSGFVGKDGDPCSFFQTQAAQTVLQSREGPAMPRMAILMGLMGIGMSGYSSRQLTLHYKPSSHLLRWGGLKMGEKHMHTHTQ